MERCLYCKAMEGLRRADYTSLVAGSLMLARLTSAKDAKTDTRYISNSSQIPWYTKGAGWRHLCMHHKLSVMPRPHRLFHLSARPSFTSERPSRLLKFQMLPGLSLQSMASSTGGFR